MGPKKVVLDTNIFISALGWEGNPARVFLMFLRGECELITSHQQLEELNRVLGYDKFIFVQEEKNTFLRSILRDAIIVETSGSVHVISDDPTDDVILETAVSRIYCIRRQASLRTEELSGDTDC